MGVKTIIMAIKTHEDIVDIFDISESMVEHIHDLCDYASEEGESSAKDVAEILLEKVNSIQGLSEDLAVANKKIKFMTSFLIDKLEDNEEILYILESIHDSAG